MPSNVLVKRVVTAGQVYELRGGSIPEAIGPAAGASGTLGSLRQYANWVARQAGRLWTINGSNPATVDYWDPDTDAWVTVHTITNTGATTINGGLRGFEAVTGVDGRLYLVAVHKDFVNNRIVFVTIDDTGAVTEWPGGVITGTINTNLNDCQSLVYKSQLYVLIWNDNGGGDQDRFCSFEPSTGVITTFAFPVNDNTTNPTNGWLRACFFSHDDRLFMIGSNQDNHDAYTFELQFGGWVAHTAANTRHFWQSQGQGYHYGCAFFHKGAAYLGFRVTTGGPVTLTNSGLTLWKNYAPTPGAAPVASYLNLWPAGMQAGQNTVGDSFHYGLWAFVDDQEDPANPVPYLIFVPDLEVSQIASVFRLSKPSNDPSVDDESLEYVGDLSVTSEYAFPDTFWGAGPFLNGRETVNAKLVTAQVTGSQKGTQGVLLDARAFGDPLVVPHGAVAAGPFEVGENVSSTSGGTATILEARANELRLFNIGGTGVFADTDTITQTTGPNTGANATQTGASSGGLADKTLRFRYYLRGTKTLGVPSTGICTLVSGTNTQGTLVKSPGADEIQDLKADHLLGINPTPLQVEWDFLADGISEAQISMIKAEVVRP